MSDKNTVTANRTDWFKVIVGFAMLVFLVWFGKSFLIPLVVAGLTFVLSSALVDRLVTFKVGERAVPTWLANLLSVVLMIFGLLLLIPIFAGTQEELIEAIPRYEERLSTIATDIETIVGPAITDALRHTVTSFDPVSIATLVVAELASSVPAIAVIVMYLGFLMSERSEWAKKLALFGTSKEESEKLLRVAVRMADGIKTYMWVNAITSLMSALVAFTVFSLIGLDFAAFLSVLIFLVGFIPNIGAFIAVVLPACVALLQFEGFGPFLAVVFVYGLADQVIANIITPTMQGRSLRISTFVVIIALAFWTSLWGGIGAFLAMPLTIMAMVICAEIPSMRWLAVFLSKDGLVVPSAAETHGN